MKQSYVLTTAPAAATNVVSLSEVKDWLRITDSNQDDLLTRMITNAVDFWREKNQWAFLDESWTLYMDDFPRSSSEEIAFKYGPLQSVTSIKYYDSDNVQQTWAAANYNVDTADKQGRITAVDDWPDVYDDGLNAVEIEFVIGYGAAGSPNPVPEPIRDAVLRTIAMWWWDREGTMGVGKTTETIMAEYRVFGFGA